MPRLSAESILLFHLRRTMRRAADSGTDCCFRSDLRRPARFVGLSALRKQDQELCCFALLCQQAGLRLRLRLRAGDPSEGGMPMGWWDGAPPRGA